MDLKSAASCAKETRVVDSDDMKSVKFTDLNLYLIQTSYTLVKIKFLTELPDLTLRKVMLCYRGLNGRTARKQQEQTWHYFFL